MYFFIITPRFKKHFNHNAFYGKVSRKLYRKAEIELKTFIKKVKKV